MSNLKAIYEHPVSVFILFWMFLYTPLFRIEYSFLLAYAAGVDL